MHGDPAGQAARARAVREAAARCGVEVGILADLPGPKLRIEKFAEGRVQLKAGDRFDLVARADAPPGTPLEVGVSYLGLPADVEPGDTLLLDDGLMQLRVEGVEGARIRTTVLNDGALSDRKGLNRLGGGLSLGALTDRDRELIRVAAELDVDFIAVSFCRNAADMRRGPPGPSVRAADVPRTGNRNTRDGRSRSAARRNSRSSVCLARSPARACRWR